MRMQAKILGIVNGIIWEIKIGNWEIWVYLGQQLKKNRQKIRKGNNNGGNTLLYKTLHFIV